MLSLPRILVALGPILAAVGTAALETGTHAVGSSAPAKLVHVAAFAADSRGRGVDLAQTDFEVFEDGIPQPTTAVLGPNAPVELMLVLDISSSMEPVLPEVRLAVNDLLQELRDTDTVRLFTFSDKFAAVPRARTWSVTLDGLIPRGVTALYDGLYEAAGRVSTGPAKRALIVFSDSADQGSRASLLTVSERVLAMDAALFWVVLGPDRNPRDVKDAFDDLAAGTGGRLVRANRGQLRRAFGDLRAELSRFHLMTYESVRDAVDGRIHSIEVRTPNRRDVRLRTRTRYMDAR